MGVVRRGQPGPDVQEPAHARLAGQVPHRPLQERPVGPHRLQSAGKRRQPRLRRRPVGREVVLPAQLSRAIGNVSDSVLSDRLAELTGAGLVTRHVAEGPPVTVTYTLTASGRALLPALELIAEWAQQHLPADED